MSFFSHVGAGDTERICDLCGIRRAMRRLRSVGKYYVCEKHPGYVTREALERTPYITVGAPEGVKNAKAFDTRDTYEAAEAEVYKFVTASTIGPDTYTITNGALLPNSTGAQFNASSIGWECVYLYEMIVEAERPLAWIGLARARLEDFADSLLSNMVGGPGVSGYTNDQMEWGAYLRTSFYNTQDSADAGLGLLRAYQILGDPRYIAGARACAWYLRSAQCGDMLTSFPSSSDSAGSVPKHWGMWSQLVQPTTNYFSHRYSGTDLTGMEFLHLLMTEVGDELIGSATITAPFNASRECLISTAIAECKAFWTVPVWSADDSAMIQGLSTTTPYNDFDSYPTVKGIVSGRGSWRFLEGNTSPTTGETVSAANFIRAIRAFRAVDGETSFVTGLFDWIAALPVNTTFDLPATTENRMVSGYDERYLVSRQVGPFDPEIAPPTIVTCRAGTPLARITPKCGSSFYSLSNLGLVADMYVARFPAKFKSLKDELSLPRGRLVDGGGSIYLGILGICGFSFQPFSSTSARSASVGAAARTGLIYRRAPKAATGRGVGA